MTGAALGVAAWLGLVVVIVTALVAADRWDRRRQLDLMLEDLPVDVRARRILGLEKQREVLEGEVRVLPVGSARKALARIDAIDAELAILYRGDEAAPDKAR